MLKWRIFWRVLSVSSLEFVAVDRGKMFQQLNEGYCDIVMSGLVVTPERAEAASLSTPYMEATLAFVVQDYRRSEFSSREALEKLKALESGHFGCALFYLFRARTLAQSRVGDREFRRRVFCNPRENPRWLCL